MNHKREAAAAGQPVPETKGRTIRSWARWYDVVSWLLSFGRGPAIREMILDMSGLKSAESVLDVGCGTGTLALAAKNRVGPEGVVVGLDASPEMVQVAQQKASKAGAGVSFQVGLIEDLPLPDAHFDIVLSSFMLHHLPEEVKRKGFAEIQRVLKPGGRFFAVDFGSQSGSIMGHLLEVLGHRHGGNDMTQLAAMMKEAGFTKVESGPTKFRSLSFLHGR